MLCLPVLTALVSTPSLTLLTPLMHNSLPVTATCCTLLQTTPATCPAFFQTTCFHLCSSTTILPAPTILPATTILPTPAILPATTILPSATCPATCLQTVQAAAG